MLMAMKVRMASTLHSAQVVPNPLVRLKYESQDLIDVSIGNVESSHSKVHRILLRSVVFLFAQTIAQLSAICKG